MVSFTSETPINSTNGCFVNYTFPKEFDLSKFDATNIEATGMFVDAQGNPQKTINQHNFNDLNQKLYWVVVQGCQFDPENRSDETLKNFEQNVFNVTFFNLINPWSIINTNELKIEVFKEL